MGKTQLNMRVDSDKLDRFKSMADSRNITQAELLERMIKDNSQGKTIEGLTAQLEEKNSIINNMKRQFGEPTVLDMRRVTFTVTNEQFDYITKLAHKLECPKKYLMREYFLKSETPQLPSLIVK